MEITYTRYKADTLKAADKLVRYKNHIAFIHAYIKAKKLPKGFKLKFHSNTNLDVSNILLKCSTMIMKRTMIYYKNEAKKLHEQIKNIKLHIVTDIKTHKYITTNTLQTIKQQQQQQSPLTVVEKNN